MLKLWCVMSWLFDYFRKIASILCVCKHFRNNLHKSANHTTFVFYLYWCFFSLIEFFYMLTIQAPGVISYSSFEYITNWMSVCTGVAISIQIKKLFIRVRISSAHLICSSQMGRSGWNYVRLWVDIQYILMVDSRTQ